MQRRHSPNQDRLAELCALRRSLSDGEQAEVMRLKRSISNVRSQRRRYASDARFRECVKERNLRRYHEAQA